MCYLVVHTKKIQLRSKGESDIIDITDQASQAIRESQIENGLVTVFISGSTAAVTTIEYEPGLKDDFPKMLSRVAPENIEYKHDNTWHDGKWPFSCSCFLDRTEFNYSDRGRWNVTRNMATNSSLGIGY